MRRSFDAIIVGAGQAGPPLADKLTKAGWTVALIERKQFGGTSLNSGCTPTRALISSARAAHMDRHAEDFGIVPSIAVTMDMRGMQSRVDAIVANARDGLETWVTCMERCTVYRVAGRFLSSTVLRVGDDIIDAARIFINVGARPAIPKLPGIAGVPYMTSSTIIHLDYLPRDAVVVGGGYIGLEFAQMYRRFGSDVTIVERGRRLILDEDEDISAAICSMLEAEGIEVQVQAECIELQERGEGIAVITNRTEGKSEVQASHVLLAVGRTPNTDDLGLETTGIILDERGYIPVDEQLRTIVPGLWALGECNGRGAFAHTAHNDSEIIAANLLHNGRRKVSDRISAQALYLDPPLARIGMTEQQVRGRGRPALIGTRPIHQARQAGDQGRSQGLIKVFVDAESEEILGASILGTGSDEAIHSILTAMYAGKPASWLQRSMHIHGTVAALIPMVLGELKPLI